MSNSNGFSLLEVLVAFAIAVPSLGLLLEIAGRATESSRLSREYSHAVAAAESLLAEYSLIQQSPGATSGSRDDGLEWIFSSEPLSGRAPLSLVRSRVEVRWQSTGSAKSVVLEVVRPVEDDRD